MMRCQIKKLLITKTNNDIRNDFRFIDSNENEIYFAIASYVTTRVKNFSWQMNQIKSIGTFYKKVMEFEVTNKRVLIAVDRMSSAVKLVDRLEFSTVLYLG